MLSVITFSQLLHPTVAFLQNKGFLILRFVYCLLKIMYISRKPLRKTIASFDFLLMSFQRIQGTEFEI